jgi:hypothetical protein
MWTVGAATNAASRATMSSFSRGVFMGRLNGQNSCSSVEQLLSHCETPPNTYVKLLK